MNAPRTSCPFAHDDGAYVLGSLSPAERLEFERHLAGCEDCTRAVRGLAGLPGLLGRIDESLLAEPRSSEPVPETLLPALTEQVQRVRRRRTRTALLVATAAASVIVTLLVVAVQLGDDTPAEPAAGPDRSEVVTREMDPVGEVPVTARLSMEQVKWGTRLGLTCTYDRAMVDFELPPEVDYWLVVHTDDGRTERVGSWRSIDGLTMEFTAGTRTDRDDISSVEVRAPGGRVVLELGT